MNDAILKHILKHITMKANVSLGNGLFAGKSGQIIFLYHLSRATNDKQAEQLADTLWDDMYISLKSQNKLSAPNFDNGLAGIGWSQEYLVEHKFCEGNTDYILKDIDDAVFKVLNEAKDIPFYMYNGLIGYLIYEISRLKNPKHNNVTTRINQELFIKILNKIDEIAPNEFAYMGKETIFDLFWTFSTLISTMDKALELNIYSEKILVMIDQWMYYLNTHLPGIHCHRLSLAISLHKINKKLERSDIDKLVQILLFSIDFDILCKEIAPYYVFDIRHSWYGVVLLLHYAQKSFDADYSYYDMFEQLRLKIISLYKEKAENEIMSGFKTSFEKKRDVNLGLANGLSGIGLVYLLYPESIKQ